MVMNRPAYKRGVHRVSSREVIARQSFTRVARADNLIFSHGKLSKSLLACFTVGISHQQMAAMRIDRRDCASVIWSKGAVSALAILYCYYQLLRAPQTIIAVSC